MNRKIIITSCIFALILFILYVIKQDKSVRHKIYFSHKSEFSFNKIFGRIPENYYTNYEETIIKESDSFQLINIIDKKNPFYSNDIILVNKKQKTEKIIKGYPFNILSSQKEMVFNYDEYTALLIDLKVFNEYIELLDLKSQEDVINEFLYLLSNINLPDSYHKINNVNDLIKLTSNNPIVTNNLINTGYKIIDINNFKLSTNLNEIYCWYLNWGVVKFEFEFQENSKEIRLINVKSKVEGILGNELLNCC